MRMDTVGAEVSALRRKLESKTEALLILSQELNRCRLERDQLKSIIDRVHTVNSSHKPLVHEDYGLYSGCYSCNSQLQDIKERNRVLILEVEDLKQKLQEAYGDIKVLRRSREFRETPQLELVSDQKEWKEEAVKRIEEMASKADLAERALRESEDSRAEAEREANALRKLNSSLRAQLGSALQAVAQGKSIDLDTILMENKYLQDRLDQALAEKELCHQTLTKYKSVLDKRKTKGSVKLGSRAENYGMVVSHKQAQELLEGGRDSWQMTEATIADLRSLSLALLDALQDKSLALCHQKKANKILASRVTELESRLGTSIPLLQPCLSLADFQKLCVSSQPVQKGSEKNDSLDRDDQVIETDSESLFGKTSDDGEVNEQPLPADLQELVMKAMMEIKQGSHTID